MNFVGSPIVTYVADKTGKHGAILLATLTISVLARLVFFRPDSIGDSMTTLVATDAHHE
jgi:hypothetical protein